MTSDKYIQFSASAINYYAFLSTLAYCPSSSRPLLRRPIQKMPQHLYGVVHLVRRRKCRQLATNVVLRVILPQTSKWSSCDPHTPIDGPPPVFQWTHLAARLYALSNGRTFVLQGSVRALPENCRSRRGRAQRLGAGKSIASHRRSAQAGDLHLMSYAAVSRAPGCVVLS